MNGNIRYYDRDRLNKKLRLNRICSFFIFVIIFTTCLFGIVKTSEWYSKTDNTKNYSVSTGKVEYRDCEGKLLLKKPTHYSTRPVQWLLVCKKQKTAL